MAHATLHRANVRNGKSALNVRIARNVRNVVAVAVVVQTARKCHKLKFGAKHDLKVEYRENPDPRVGVTSLRKIAKDVARTAVAIAGSPVVNPVMKAVLTALPAPMTARQVQHLPRWLPA